MNFLLLKEFFASKNVWIVKKGVFPVIQLNAYFVSLLIKNNNYINSSHEILDKEINLDERI